MLSLLRFRRHNRCAYQPRRASWRNARSISLFSTWKASGSRCDGARRRTLSARTSSSGGEPSARGAGGSLPRSRWTRLIISLRPCQQRCSDHELAFHHPAPFRARAFLNGAGDPAPRAPWLRSPGRPSCLGSRRIGHGLGNGALDLLPDHVPQALAHGRIHVAQRVGMGPVHLDVDPGGDRRVHTPD